MAQSGKGIGLFLAEGGWYELVYAFSAGSEHEAMLLKLLGQFDWSGDSHTQIKRDEVTEPQAVYKTFYLVRGEPELGAERLLSRFFLPGEGGHVFGFVRVLFDLRFGDAAEVFTHQEAAEKAGFERGFD